MTSEGLGEMFEGDSADMCAGKFPLVLMGGSAKRGPPSALMEILIPFSFCKKLYLTPKIKWHFVYKFLE